MSGTEDWLSLLRRVIRENVIVAEGSTLETDRDIGWAVEAALECIELSGRKIDESNAELSEIYSGGNPYDEYTFACCGAKPCPFCGAHPVAQRVGDDVIGYNSVECEHCNGGKGVPFVGVHAGSRDEAIAIWNRRDPNRPKPPEAP